MSIDDNIEADAPIGTHHYRAFIGPPEKYDLVAAMQFNLLTHLGLREFHYLLDIGCGSLRAGRLLIPYLMPAHYFGIEPEQWLVEQGLQNELGQDIVRIKKPVFNYEAQFDCGKFGQAFDFVLAQSVFSHASQAQIRKCLSNVQVCMRPNGIWAATFVRGTSDYNGQEWVYPGCVTYTIERMKLLAAESGLEAAPIDWPHPNGQTWLLLTRAGHRVVPSSPRLAQKSRKIRRRTESGLPTEVDQPICIIGMHRSGTSMVARLLNLCGVNLGPEEKLLEASPDNAMGHFEHKGFLEIDDAILRCFGGSWDNPPFLDVGWENDSCLRDLFAQAKGLIDGFKTSALWGWKDPRATLLLPFWKTLLPNLRYIICIRNPLDVARSLGKRDGISLPGGTQLWSRYTRAAIENTEGQPRILTFYENFFSNPIDELNRLVNFGGLPEIGDPSSVMTIISAELRHQITGIVELLQDADLPFEPKFLYLGLRALSSEDFARRPHGGKVEEVAATTLRLLLNLADELRNQETTARLETMLAQKELEYREAQRQLSERAIQIDLLKQDNACLQAFSDAVRQTLAYRLYARILRPLRNTEAVRKL
jgi:hypothetical protein